jgi:hypothetical protein
MTILDNFENPRGEPRYIPCFPTILLIFIACSFVGGAVGFINLNTNEKNSSLPLDCDSGQVEGQALIVNAQFGRDYPVDWFGSVYIEKGKNVEGDYLKSNLPFGQVLNSTDVHPVYRLIEVKSILNGKGVVFKEFKGTTVKSGVTKIYTETLKDFPIDSNNVKHNIEAVGSCVK